MDFGQDTSHPQAAKDNQKGNAATQPGLKKCTQKMKGGKWSILKTISNALQISQIS